MKHERATRLYIRTPEGIAFSLPLASPATRALAWLIDLACLAVMMQIVGFGMQLIGILSADLAMGMMIFVFFVLQLGYAIACEWFWRGQTVGKRVLRLRVMDSRGLRLHFSQIMLRNLLRCIDAMPLCYLVGGLACLFSRKAQRLGDLVAGTVVVRIIEAEPLDLRQIEPGKFNSFRHYPHLAARLRQRVAPETVRIALQALLRRDRLDSNARIELFREIAAELKAAVEFPADAISGLSDERYVHNAVEILFFTRTQPTGPRQPR
jgi:uncharacterized RDD family membrane protein YckC